MKDLQISKSKWKDVQCHQIFGEIQLKLQWDITSHLLEWLLSRKDNKEGWWEGGEEMEPCIVLEGMLNGGAPIENGIIIFIKLK